MTDTPLLNSNRIKHLNIKNSLGTIHGK